MVFYFWAIFGLYIVKLLPVVEIVYIFDMPQNNTILVTNIIHGSYVDGPGMRTVFFLKGCPLACGWCHNPETQKREQEILYDIRRCIRCGACFDICNCRAIDYRRAYIIDLEKCTLCFRCVDVCPTDALQAAGTWMTVDAVMSEIVKDTVFYESSGGGVTFSGGEPLLQYRSLKEVLVLCRDKGIHTCIDTSLAVPWEIIAFVKDHVDLFMVDIKHSARKEVLPDLVFDNCEKLAGASRIWIRIPVIPDWNDTEEEMQKTAHRLESVKGKIEQVSLLPFHTGTEMKYRCLNRVWHGYGNKRAVSADTISLLNDVFIRNSFTVM